MKSFTLRYINLIIALCISALFYFLTFTFLKLHSIDFSALHLLAPTLVFGIFCFLIVWGLLHTFVYSRVKSSIKKIVANKNPENSSIVETPNHPDPLHNLYVLIKQWIEERKNEIEKTKKLEQHRKEYIGNVSHELKTPIFNIQGYISTLLDGGLSDPTINTTYLQRADKSVDRMITIIGDLETISQLETGQLTLEYERFDVVSLVKDIFESQELKAKNKKITLSIKDGLEPVYANADRFRIRQVLTNLIVNSINYGKEGGETKVKIFDTGESVLVEVADNGIGIAKEHLHRVFERFYRIDKSRSRDQGGTGLGLAIAKHIIEAHNQTINVMSTEGAGSVFSFTLKKG